MLSGAIARQSLWACAGLAAGLLLAWVVTRATPEIYTSRALIRTTPGSIPQRFVPATPSLTADELLRASLPALLSRNTLSGLIQTYNLYPERSDLPTEDVVELVRNDVEIHATNAQAIAIAFSYHDRFVAQKVTRDFLTRLIDETGRERTALSQATVSFLERQAERAAETWIALDARLRQEGRSERLVLDRDLARRHYETLRQQGMEAQMIVDLDERRQGPAVEVLDLPSLPERPELSHARILAAGALLGLLLGWMSGWLRNLRWRQPPMEPATLH